MIDNTSTTTAYRAQPLDRQHLSQAPINSAEILAYEGADHDGFGVFRHLDAGRTHGARRRAEAVTAAMDANDGIGRKVGRRLPARVGLILDDLRRLLAYRRATGNLAQVEFGEYVAATVAPLAARALHHGRPADAEVRQWLGKNLPEFNGSPDLAAPAMSVDAIAAALVIRQDEVDANLLHALVSIDRPPEVRAADAKTYDRQYSERRRRAGGAKPMSSRTRTATIRTIATAHGVSLRTMQARIAAGLVDFDAEAAALACTNPSGTNELDSLSPTNLCSPEDAVAAVPPQAANDDTAPPAPGEVVAPAIEAGFVGKVLRLDAKDVRWRAEQYPHLARDFGRHLAEIDALMVKHKTPERNQLAVLKNNLTDRNRRAARSGRRVDGREAA
ncbi:hypothetical protein [Methylobacterium oryzihabitans]|uniref:Uncharacterized protein n=1 Tax=Methylobacterium oryzihabitans TaxID=2499852 RepID=A0A3S2XEA2_9HYPH|nr:hypothetical protein [Methylobacterium oryzihabitans]RVU12503.1 hypothetical protein EOE48_27855 [Methylobacterium oryzihabitans]